MPSRLTSRPRQQLRRSTADRTRRPRGGRTRTRRRTGASAAAAARFPNALFIAMALARRRCRLARGHGSRTQPTTANIPYAGGECASGGIDTATNRQRMKTAWALTSQAWAVNLRRVHCSVNFAV